MKTKVLLLISFCAIVLTTHAVPGIYVITGDKLLRYHARSGHLLGTIGVFPGVNSGSHQSDLTFGPDGALYSSGNGGLWRIDIGAGTASSFVTYGPEVTAAPGGFAFGGDGFLYLTSGDTLLKYDAVTGAFVGTAGTFPGASAGSYSNDLTPGPDGALYSIGNGGIWRIDIDAGTASPFVQVGSEASIAPGGFVFGDDGFLYLTSGSTLLRYDAGTGAFVETVSSIPGATTGSYSDDLTLGTNGAVYSHGPSGIWQINVHSGRAREVIDFGPEVTVRSGGFAVALP